MQKIIIFTNKNPKDFLKISADSFTFQLNEEKIRAFVDFLTKYEFALICACALMDLSRTHVLTEVQ